MSRCSLPLVSLASFWLVWASDCRAASSPLLLPVAQALAGLGSRHSFFFGFEPAFWPLQMSRCSLPLVPLASFWLFSAFDCHAASDRSSCCFHWRRLWLAGAPDTALSPVSRMLFGPSKCRAAASRSFPLPLSGCFRLPPAVTPPLLLPLAQALAGFGLQTQLFLRFRNCFLAPPNVALQPPARSPCLFLAVFGFHLPWPLLLLLPVAQALAGLGSRHNKCGC